MNKEKLAIWVLAITNPLICWSLAYLLWRETDRIRYDEAVRASKIVLVVIGTMILLSLALSSMSPS